MQVTLLQSREYREMMQRHIAETLDLLLSADSDFAVACEREHLRFDPPLPDDIMQTFNEAVLFILTGYTLESAFCKDDTLIFEAGFGADNFGSVVTVPLLAIKQIFLGETPLLLNYASLPMPSSPKAANSMEALLSNPENQKLLKKKPKKR